jgi:hypothetical protein
MSQAVLPENNEEVSSRLVLHFCTPLIEAENKYKHKRNPWVPLSSGYLCFASQGMKRSFQ